jgi:hypothetical protein
MGISGLVGVDITPERSMRAAQAFGYDAAEGLPRRGESRCEPRRPDGQARHGGGAECCGLSRARPEGGFSSSDEVHGARHQVCRWHPCRSLGRGPTVAADVLLRRRRSRHRTLEREEARAPLLQGRVQARVPRGRRRDPLSAQGARVLHGRSREGTGGARFRPRERGSRWSPTSGSVCRRWFCPVSPRLGGSTWSL